MPGLLRGIARTAVVAGTATAVSNRVSRRQAGRWSQHEYEQQQAYQQQAYEQQQAAAPPAPAAAPPPAGDDMSSKLDQLQKLGELKAQGLLTEEEFTRQKSRLLG
ncbi:SHOCT domain-containing protein [Streptomyces sp. NPDC054987]